MTLTELEFELLVALAEPRSGSDAPARPSVEELAAACSMPLEPAQACYERLCSEGLVEESALTADGLAALEPYRVDNAVIMAAGPSSRLAPISYERPKALMKARGEVLIERQIEQLYEAGITDVTVVVGYMKEQLFYLEDKLGVRIKVNEAFADRNNHASLMAVRERLGNTYICSSDNYFTENVFRRYEYRAYYAATHLEGRTSEYCARLDETGRIVGIDSGGEDADVLMGHAYFDRSFSHAFVDVLKCVYDDLSTAPKLWDDIFADHAAELPLYARFYRPGVIHEFDTLDDLRSFDPDFLDNVDSAIMENICATLGCGRADISGIVPIKQGLTNLSCKFEVGGKPYVYRHPGPGTDAIISRESETYSQQVAAELGIDKSFIYEDPEQGWKISRFIEVTEPFDFHNVDHMRRAMAMARTLHRSGAKSAWAFDIHEDTKKQMALLGDRQRIMFADFDELYALAERLNEVVVRGSGEPVLCHNDFYDPNFLIEGDDMHLIDWEYSGMSDFMSDIGVFICCADHTYEEALRVLETYFERELTDEELLHCLASISVISFHWFIWALYEDTHGQPVGELLYLWYKYTKFYGQKALELQERLESK